MFLWEEEEEEEVGTACSEDKAQVWEGESQSFRHQSRKHSEQCAEKTQVLPSKLLVSILNPRELLRRRQLHYTTFCQASFWAQQAWSSRHSLPERPHIIGKLPVGAALGFFLHYTRKRSRFCEVQMSVTWMTSNSRYLKTTISIDWGVRHLLQGELQRKTFHCPRLFQSSLSMIRTDSSTRCKTFWSISQQQKAPKQRIVHQESYLESLEEPNRFTCSPEELGQEILCVPDVSQHRNAKLTSFFSFWE